MPIFELSGQLAGASVPKLASASGQAAWPSAASGLIVRPSGKDHSRFLDLRRREGVALELFRLQLQVQPRGGVRFVGRQRRVQNRVEVEFITAIYRPQLVFRSGSVARVLVGDGTDRHGQRFPPVQTVGLLIIG